jgi:hypothetical protein
MANVIIFVLASALVGLFFSRVHFHFSFNCTVSRSANLRSLPGKRRAEISGEVPPVRSIRQHEDVTKVLQAAQDSVEADLTSALVNLGCSLPKASQVAKKAMGEGKDFDSRLQWALRNAA